MIVKNEADRIERCLSSVLPSVKAVAILDTGSTDDTKEIIQRVCEDHSVPYVIAEGPFENFSQARNLAFEVARDYNTGDRWCQFALLVDADMELVVDNPHALMLLDANALSYDMMQKAGAVSYANRRIVNLSWPTSPYVGVTHEYLDVPAAGMITGASFIDHADGSNRADKYPRDAKLLEDALKEDPNNGRYLYYLGNTYRDWGRYDLAIEAYRKRIALGGWEEETHSAMMNLATCLKDTLDEAGFVLGMLDAYRFRPSRAEPLYDLAKQYREKGHNHPALLFAKAGTNLKRPDDLLFVNDFVYSHGLRYEYSIAGYYDEKERGRAFEVTDDLALDKTCPEAFRWSARNSLYHFTKPLKEHCPSFNPKQLQFTPPSGYTAMNPSVEECNGKITCNIRCVNYKIDEHGRYMIGPLECNDAPIDTRNFLARLDTKLDVKDVAEIIWDRPPAAFPQVTGLEDIRLYRSRRSRRSRGELWFSACVRECSPNGTCQQARGRLEMWRDNLRADGPTEWRVAAWQIMSGEDKHEKNWMPLPRDGVQDFVYRLNEIVHADASPSGATIYQNGIYTDNISGGSQLIVFRGGRLAVVHEALTGPDGKRTYWHRFAYFDHDGTFRRLSMPFVFLDRQIEFCAGLAQHPNMNDLILSFGVRDAEAWIATVSQEDVAQLLWKAHHVEG
jgi:glycosyltransferase involved in cell wall biosynthesis